MIFCWLFVTDDRGIMQSLVKKGDERHLETIFDALKPPDKTLTAALGLTAPLQTSILGNICLIHLGGLLAIFPSTSACFRLPFPPFFVYGEINNHDIPFRYLLQNYLIYQCLRSRQGGVAAVSHAPRRRQSRPPRPRPALPGLPLKLSFA